MYPYLYIFGLRLPSYGLMAVAGLLSGFGLFFLSRKKYALTLPQMASCLLYAVVGGYLGAKLLFIIVDWKHVFAGSDLLSSLISTGFVFYGGLIGAALMLMLYAKKSRTPLYVYSDPMLPCFCVFHSLGRIGCFLAGCCYGCETDGPLGVCFPEGGVAPSGVSLLPVQLFEAIFLLLLTAVLLLLLKKQRLAGLTTSVYMLVYPAWRFFIEFFRSDNRGSVGGLSTSQFISIIIFALGVFLLVKWGKNLHRTKKESTNEKI